MTKDIKVQIDEFLTLEDESCVVVWQLTEWVGGVQCYGTFDDDEEARTFIACGPHGLEEYTMLAKVVPLYPPHAEHVEPRNVFVEVGV